MNIDYEFACQDDCLDKMVPSDLRKLICERDQAYRNIDVITAERDAYLAELQKANAVIIDLQRNPPKYTASHLAEIRAEAGRDGFIEGVEWQLYNYNEPTNKIDAADKYADSIRKESK